MKKIVIEIPADYFFKGSPPKQLEFTRESIERAIENARKVFGPDFMAEPTDPPKH